MSHGYGPGLVLERVRAAGDFTRANCRWVEARELHARRPRVGRARYLVSAYGEAKGPCAWTRDRRCKVKQSALGERLRAGWPPEEAIALPPGSRPSRLVRASKELRKPRGRTRAEIDWNEVRRLYRQGLTEEEVARRMGAKLSSIQRGFTRRRLRRKRSHALRHQPERRRLEMVWRRTHATARARRISVAPVWREFAPFYAWARASGARKGLWLTRRVQRWGYSPANCEWVPQAEAIRRGRASP